MAIGKYRYILITEKRLHFVQNFGSPLWQFKVMPFGLCNAPAMFEHLIEMVLRGLSFEACVIYLHDIIIVGRTFEHHLSKMVLRGLSFEACVIYLHDIIVEGRTFEHHLSNIRKILEKLRKTYLELNLSICKLFCPAVNYLGHIISIEGVRNKS